MPAKQVKIISRVRPLRYHLFEQGSAANTTTAQDFRNIMSPTQLYFVTGNKNKLSEVNAILGDLVALKSQALDLIEIQGSIEEISLDKCRRAAELVWLCRRKHSSCLDQ